MRWGKLCKTQPGFCNSCDVSSVWPADWGRSAGNREVEEVRKNRAGTDLQWWLGQSQFCVQGSYGALVQSVGQRQAGSVREGGRKMNSSKIKRTHIFFYHNFKLLFFPFTLLGLGESSASGSPVCSCPSWAAGVENRLEPQKIFKANT